ncbi:hypothetical protein CLV98_103392 [Dyadobacter jejuensis]|uniref:Uncharacterized protein n=1 Tax=Dyadobacter jejuensis TaxID=1082580 RepID=A0A316ANW8_9BACT|nr:DUF6134 family protein [Dyadobacter jejuensis]PWJ59019.1 hypothetical protein CLV98_103392 [Dyadobacter jejuensis]
MRVLIKAFLLLGLLEVQTVEGYAQERFFTVQVGGKNVGQLTVFPMDTNLNRRFQRVESEFKFLFQEGKYSNRSAYANGLLLHSTSIHSLNGEMKEKTVTKYTINKTYDILFFNADGSKKDTRQIVKPIYNTITNLYYQEPVGLKQVYSERFAEFCSIVPLSKQQYAVTMPDGKLNIFSYRSGQFIEMETEMIGFQLKVVPSQGKKQM